MKAGDVFRKEADRRMALADDYSVAARANQANAAMESRPERSDISSRFAHVALRVSKAQTEMAKLCEELAAIYDRYDFEDRP